jgi:hypothetical protein
MSDYTENFTSVSGDTVDSTELETEFDAIATAIATKLDSDGSGAMTGALSMGSNKVTSVTDPTSAQDAATKAYVDGAEVIGFSAPATGVIVTSEAVEDSITIAIPSSWGGYYLEAQGIMEITETTAMSSDITIEIRVRSGTGTGGTILSTVTVGVGQAVPDNTVPVPVYAYLASQSTTGNVSMAVTSQASGESGKMSHTGFKWRLKARRTS